MIVSIRSWHLLPRSFRAQLACCFALLGAVLAVSLSAGLGTMLAQKSRREATASLHTVAQNAARLLADGLALRLREVQILAESPTLWSEGLDSARVAQVFYRSQAINPYSAWIGVADRDGVVRTATGNMLVGANVGERPWYIAGARGLFLGDVHPAKLLATLLPPGSDGGPQRFVDFAAPIRRDGQLLGVLCVHGSWEWTRATIESLLPDAAHRMALDVFIFDRHGQLIYAPDSTLSARLQTAETLPILSRQNATDAVRDTDPAVTRWHDGEDYITAAIALDAPGAINALGWTVVARQPISVAHAAARHGALVALLMGLTAAAMSAGLGWWLSTRLTQPLRRMARDAQAIEAAGADPQAVPLELQPLRGSVEIEQLSGALSGMTHRLLQANAELELRVQERTAELERANAALERLAHHDSLTGLLNRRGFDERMAAALSSARRRQAPLSLLIVDADHFKRVNDHHGHDVGDQVLQAISQTLRKRLREVDFVARIGGEEFVVVLPDTGSLGASHVAESLVAAMAHTEIPIVGTVTLSCGVAAMQIDTETPEDALKRADAALYRAKQSGRNRHCMAEDASVGPVPGPVPSLAATPRAAEMA